MPTLSSGDLAIYRAGQPSIRRYLSVAPRTSVYTATVSAVSTDDETGGIHQLTLTGGVGTLADVCAGYTVDIGTAAGKHDIGQFRVRSVPTGADLDVGETACAACPVVVGQHVTIRAERRLWRVLPRIVGTRGTGGFLDTFTDYADYDIPYTDQNDAIQPHANITADADGTPVRPAGFVDAGQTYRTVTLHAGTSVALADGANIASVLWDAVDGTITSGTTASTTITVRFPAGFRYLSLTVTDSDGTTHTRTLPIWAHDADNPPLTAFHVIRDVRTANTGRMMEFEFFGADDSLDGSTFPEGATLCYWEIAAFGASGTPAPASQTDAMLGWAIRDAETLRIGDKSRIRVEIGGLPAWLDRIAITPQTLRDLGVASVGWDNMRHITADRAAHFALRRWSNALDLANFYPSGVTDETQMFTIDGASLWRAASNAAASGRVGVLGGDSLNGLWLRRDFNHLSESERSTRSIRLALTAADWIDADGLTVETDRAAQIGTVDARGSSWGGMNAPTMIAACAPGRTAGVGTGRAKLPAQILPETDAQTVLNALVGHRHAALSNPRAPIRLRLLHPIDAIEPAWNEPVTLTWTDGSLRETALSALACMVERIEVEHHYGADEPPKVIRWTLIPTTYGEAGEAVPVTPPTAPPRPPVPPTPPRPPTNPPGIPANAVRIALFGTDNRLYRTTNFLASNPRWTNVNLAALTDWIGGTLVDFTVDAYSPGYIGGGSAVNGWIVTTVGVQKINNIFGTPTLNNGTTLTGVSAARTMNFERGVQNWGVITSYLGYGGTWAAYTLNGHNWTEVQISAAYDVNIVNNGLLWRPGLFVSPHTAGLAYTLAFDSSVTAKAWKTTDFGASWGVDAAISQGSFPGGSLVVPYQDRAASTFYYDYPLQPGTFYVEDRFHKSVDGVDIDLSLIDGSYRGSRYGVVGSNRGIALSDGDPTRVALCSYSVNGATGAYEFGVHFSRDGGDTFTKLVTPSTSVPYRSVYLAGDDSSTLYLIGDNGAVGKSTAAASGSPRIQSKKGNLSMTGILVGLCGG